MTDRIFNFSAGPATLPVSSGTGPERNRRLSRRGDVRDGDEPPLRGLRRIIKEAEDDLRALLGIPENYKVLFLQGGASLQFTMVPMNLLPKGERRLHHDRQLVQGAIKEAKKSAPCAKPQRRRTPTSIACPRGGYQLDPPRLTSTSPQTRRSSAWSSRGAARASPARLRYVVRFHQPPDRHVEVRSDLRGRAEERRPGRRDHRHRPRRPAGTRARQFARMLDYRNAGQERFDVQHAALLRDLHLWLVFKWASRRGRLATMHARKEKARFSTMRLMRPTAITAATREDCRSLMNVTFRLPSEELEKKFTKEATAAGLKA